MNQIRSFGEKLLEHQIVEKVVRSLPPKFDHVLIVIEKSKNISDYSLVELMGSFGSHEEQFKRTTETIVEQTLQTKVDVQKKSKGLERGGLGGDRRQGRGHSNRGRGHDISKGQKRATCSHYGKTDHMEMDCWHKNK